jgi:general secretion pathway protein E
VTAVLAQRLVRRTCAACAGAGCAACRATGFRGRTGIHELLVVDDAVRTHVMARADAATIRRDARAAGMTALREDGLAKARAGVTTQAEVLRLTQDES